MDTHASSLLIGLLVFAASALSLRLGVSVAVFELLLGFAAGNLGLEPPGWLTHVGAFGGLLLTFLAGAEVDAALLRRHAGKAAAVGLGSFLAPLAAGYLFCRYAAGWSPAASLLAGIALSETSLAVVYSVLAETGRGASRTGRLLMACTFVTNTLTAVALSLAFMRPDALTVLFLAGSAAFLLFAGRLSGWLMARPALAGKTAEPEIKYVFAVILGFAWLASAGGGQAMLPVFLFGLAAAPHLAGPQAAVKLRLRTVAYAFVTPCFFLAAGMKVSATAVLGAAGLAAALFAVKQAAKFAGVYFLARRHFPAAKNYFTLLMSTGLTFGLLAALWGAEHGVLDASQYSVLTGVLLASAVLPAFAAQRWFPPAEDEDLPA